MAPFGISDTMTTKPTDSGPGFSIPNTIQTDAPINPWNSDSPSFPALKFYNAKRCH